jgi:hypothetical protein
MLVNVGVAGATSAGVMYMSGLPAQNLFSAFLTGGASKLAGDYANDKLFDSRNGLLGPIF